MVRAEVAQQEARGLAMTGEAGSVDAKLDEAWRVLDEVSPIPGELGSHYDSSLLTMQTAICFCEAGQPGRCTARASTTSDSRTATAATSCR